MKKVSVTGLFLVLPWLVAAMDGSEDLALRLVDRAALERVYYLHRVGEKPPFEQVLPPDGLQNLVRQDLGKEAALKHTYGVVITPSMLDTEVQRINTTTRAPEILAEIKNALGRDPVRFANAFAKPIIVERLLREKFDNDDPLHAPQRRQIERVRNELLTAKTNGAACEQLLALLHRNYSNQVAETTWQLGSHPEAKPAAEISAEVEIKKRFGPEAQILSSPPGGTQDRKLYFEDLPAGLQNVLRAQLRTRGDVSAVIEMPGAFLLYLAKEKTDKIMSVATLALSKRGYEQWLAEQSNR